MAQKAIMIDQFEYHIEKDIAELTEADFYNSFICSGLLADGTMCAAPMRPSQNKEPAATNYFYEASRNHPHKPLCPCARRKKKTTVEKLDRRGTGKTNHALYDSLNRDKIPLQKSPKESPLLIVPEEDNQLIPSADNTKDENSKEIQSKLRMPRDLDEYTSLLASLSQSDKYMDTLVFDQILDERTVEAYRRMGLPTERPFVITARRTLPYAHNIQLDNNQWLLVDYWATGKNKGHPIVFLLHVTNGAKKKLLNLCKIEPSVKIFIYGIFHKHPTSPQTYVSDLLKDHMISAAFGD